MTLPREPSLEKRRQKELEAELGERARAWLPDWRPRDANGDFASALFGIVARIESEVTQRLAQVPKKTFLGFLHWLGVRGKPGLAARVPVVFSMTAGSDPVDAPAGVQMQATPAGSEPVTLETTTPLRVLPARLVVAIAADPADDALFSAQPLLFSLEAPKAIPTRWRLASDAALDETRLQLEPELGLEVGMMLVEPESGQRYTVTAVDGGIVTIDPSLGNVAARSGSTAVAPRDLRANDDEVVRLVEFDAFGATERNVQQHELYLGSSSALDIETAAVIEIVNGGVLPSDAKWSFWGKSSANAAANWVDLEAIEFDGGLYLVKPAGAVEEKKIDGYKSRWIKATRAPSGALEASTTASHLNLRVNCKPDPDPKHDWPARLQAALDTATKPGDKKGPTVEGIANTAPLVLSGDFYPLGREPRLFDAFYLGSQEMFSKPSAKAWLHFTIGGSFSAPLVGVAFTASEPSAYLVASVSDDGKLYRLWLSETGGDVPAPKVQFLSSTQPHKDGRPLRLRAEFRPGAVQIGTVAYFAVGTEDAVWLFTQRSQNDAGNWLSLGALPKDVDRKPELGDTVIVRERSFPRVYVVVDGKLYFNEGTDWKPAENAPAGIARLVAIVDPNDDAGVLADGNGLACITTDGKLYAREANAPIDQAWTEVALVDSLSGKLDAKFYPLVVIDDAQERTFLLRETTQGELVALKESGQAHKKRGTVLGRALSCLDTREAHAVAVIADDDKVNRPLIWGPFVSDRAVVGDAPGTAFSDGPLVLGKWALFPCQKGAVAVAPCLTPIASVLEAALTDAVIVKTRPEFTSDRLLFVRMQGRGAPARIAPASGVVLEGDEVALVLDAPGPPEPRKVRVAVYAAPPSDTQRSGRRTAGRSLNLENGDSATTGEYLCIVEGASHSIVKVKSVNGSVVTFHPSLGDVNQPVDVKYHHVERIVRSHHTHVLPSVDASRVNAAVLPFIDKSLFRFETLRPHIQDLRALALDRSRVVLAHPWLAVPSASMVDYTVVRGFGKLVDFEPPQPDNPELDWEYFNGKSWWKIPGVVDGTDNLLNEGDVVFCVPADLQPTDVAGRTNHWVRARLVAGNYGQEAVTAVTRPTSDGKGTVQTIVRDTDSLRPPFVINLEAYYSICCAVEPGFVLTRDGAGLRDQSRANKTSGAVIQCFVPLAQTLAEYGNQDDGPADPGGPAIYLGFDDELTGGPIHLLFRLEDGADGAFPLRVEALVGERFQRVVSNDGTRGLSESGIITLSLRASPQATSLFGRAAHWLRLRPAAGADAASWRPRIYGVYVNAAWAVAAETQSNELLGSSDGSPAQKFTLARTPVLESSLVLRVREPLGDEEKAALIASDPDSIREELAGRPGPWVLWREVADPVDWGPAARVFALDSKLGTVTVGDGHNGRVPPIGRDCIMAERYLRGGGAAANDIGAFSPISLSTPLQGVDGVVAPDRAAGGSDPQDAATAIRFAPSNLNGRDRALSLADFEALALQSSPHVAQVRATSTTSGARLVVVMRGEDARPSNAVLRALKSELLARALPSFAARGALELLPPTIVPLRVQLRLTIADVEQTGAVAAETATRIARWLDPASGGQDGKGWPLGERLTATDIAACLVDLAHVESLDRCVISVQADDGTLSDLPDSLRARELVALVPGDVTVECAVSGEEAT